MALSMTEQLMATLSQLRYEPSVKRLRAALSGEPVVDTTRAVLVWEPMRIVPSWAVPVDDITATLTLTEAGPLPEFRAVGFGPDSPPLLDPSVPFAVHTADGIPLQLTTAAGRASAFRLTDPDLADYVVLDFDAFAWREEDQPVVGHARDPLHRIDVCPSSQRLRIEHDGTVLAESVRAQVLFEATFPLARYYLPVEDVRVELRPSTLRTTCAYKGHASYWTAVLPDEELTDIAWSYPSPEHDADRVRGLVCFFNERVDVFVDGRRLEKVRTPWSDPGA